MYPSFWAQFHDFFETALDFFEINVEKISNFR